VRVALIRFGKALPALAAGNNDLSEGLMASHNRKKNYENIKNSKKLKEIVNFVHVTAGCVTKDNQCSCQRFSAKISQINYISKSLKGFKFTFIFTDFFFLTSMKRRV